jgi:pimeloyl-ACP methyl ester carboxylesterase
MPTIELERSSMSFTDVGEGPAVVLLHGSASSRHQWRSLVARLAGRYRVLAPDLHGYGGTALRDGLRLRLSDELALLRALADRAGEPFHLIGHSAGGALALGAAIGLRDRLASLTLIEPAAFQLLRLEGEDDAWHEIDDVAQRHIELAWERKYEACADLFMRYWIGARAWAEMPPERREAVVRVMPKVATEWAWIMMVETGGAEAHADLDVPTLLIRGTRTRLAARRVVDLLAATLPACTLVDIEGAGHLAPLTHPDHVDAAIEAHLDRHAYGILEAREASVLQ